MWDEKAGRVRTVSEMAGGATWSQSARDVWVEWKLPAGTRARQLAVEIHSNRLRVVGPDGRALLDGKAATLARRVRPDDSLWTIEDDGQLRVVLEKAVEFDLWPSLVRDEPPVPADLGEKMRRSMLLERFQGEHPGFDFSGAEFSGAAPTDIGGFMRPDGQQ